MSNNTSKTIGFLNIFIILLGKFKNVNEWYITINKQINKFKEFSVLLKFIY